MKIVVRLLQAHRSTVASAPMHANLHGAESLELITSRELARFAEKDSLQTDIPKYARVEVRVRVNWREGKGGAADDEI